MMNAVRLHGAALNDVSEAKRQSSLGKHVRPGYSRGTNNLKLSYPARL